MRSCNSYQDILSPDELEEENRYESILASLLAEYDYEGGDYKSYQSWCRKKARELAKEREEENDTIH